MSDLMKRIASFAKKSQDVKTEAVALSLEVVTHCHKHNNEFQTALNFYNALHNNAWKTAFARWLRAFTPVRMTGNEKNGLKFKLNKDTATGRIDWDLEGARANPFTDYEPAAIVEELTLATLLEKQVKFWQGLGKKAKEGKGIADGNSALILALANTMPDMLSKAAETVKANTVVLQGNVTETQAEKDAARDAKRKETKVHNQVVQREAATAIMATH
jgi:hypothetical protein